MKEKAAYTLSLSQSYSSVPWSFGSKMTKDRPMLATVASAGPHGWPPPPHRASHEHRERGQRERQDVRHVPVAQYFGRADPDLGPQDRPHEGGDQGPAEVQGVSLPTHQPSARHPDREMQ